MRKKYQETNIKKKTSRKKTKTGNNGKRLGPMVVNKKGRGAGREGDNGWDAPKIAEQVVMTGTHSEIEGNRENNH